MSDVAASWDAEYAAGRYETEPPVPFLDDILTVIDADGLPPGRILDVGCGNGRHYLPLVAAGLDVVGIDLSRVALERLAATAPDATLVHGDLDALDPSERFAAVVGIQVFQHGTEAEAHVRLMDAAARVAPGGLLCVRVNAAGTDIRYRHRVVEQNDGGGCTIEYLDGPKRGLAVHFYAHAELERLLDLFEPVLPLRLAATAHEPPARGSWAQWETIRRRPLAPD